MKKIHATQAIGMGMAVEYLVHYTFFGFLRVTGVRVRNEEGNLERIPKRQRCREWVRRDEVGYFRLEHL